VEPRPGAGGEGPPATPVAVLLLLIPEKARLIDGTLLTLHRFVAREVPIFGWRFALFRDSACSALPLVAGLIARALTRA
jgi:hypothetical protein